MRKIVTIFALFGLFTFGSNAQSLNETLTKLSLDAATQYVNPVISAFGSNLNTGWVTSVPKSELLGVNIEARFLGQFSFFPEEGKSFTSNGKFRFTSAQVDQLLDASNITNTSARAGLKAMILNEEFSLNISGPTITGAKSNEVSVNFPGKTYTYNGQNFTITPTSLKTGAKGFLDGISFMPMGAFQLNVGTVYGTDLALRFLPSVNVQDMGKFSFFGVGVIHNPGQFVPVPLPVDLAVGVFYQDMKVGELFETKALQVGIYGSKKFGGPIGITPYAGITIESATTTLTYDYKYDISVAGVTQSHSEKMTIDLKGKNTAAFTVGAKVNLGFFNIFADYKAASTSTVNGGFSFSF